VYPSGGVVLVAWFFGAALAMDRFIEK
jgi:hypothetical protein